MTDSKGRAARVKRKSVGVRDELQIINRDPNKVYRLVDNDPQRLYELQERGYVIESASNHTPKGLRTDQPLLTDNSIPVGGGKSHVLMSISREWCEEDQQEKEKINKRQEAGLKPQPSDGQYGTLDISSR